MGSEYLSRKATPNNDIASQPKCTAFEVKLTSLTRIVLIIICYDEI